MRKPIALLLFTFIATGLTAAGSDKKKEVGDYLRASRQWGLGLSTKAVDPASLSHLGKEALPLLAGYLTDDDLGDTAASTMMDLNPDEAAPFLFRSMPTSDRNVQYHTFNFYIRRIRNRHPYAYASDMRDAALRCLDAQTASDAAEAALLAIGLTGSQQDFPALKNYAAPKPGNAYWALKLERASEAALARLGSRPHIDAIAARLSAPLPKELTMDWANDLASSIESAAFADKKDFKPQLCRHLSTPAPKMAKGHVLPPRINQLAANALAQIMDGAALDQAASLEDWKARCAK